ncbi:hypothetical protein [Pseudomonas sp. CM27]|uniref:hypothetical protein n=1 Tax=Pseudomonas sp. CM27 TaxID=2738452 RepID=UPI0015566AE0|nr:hypothetical protein [Pseudomonas sp. CM27]NQD72910.1 hypothetical protein [Pseudomonas sp. CM27]
MAGQLIRLPGVTAAAAAGAPRIIMTAPDAVAAKVASLKHVVSARSMTALSGGGVTGRCRLTGKLLVPMGVDVARWQILTLGGKAALYSGPAASGGQGAAASIALPPGSLTQSYTAVGAFAWDAADRAGNYLTNFVVGFDAGAPTRRLFRAYGQQYATVEARNSLATGSGEFTSVYEAIPLTEWGIFVADYNNDTRVISLSINDADSFTQRTETVATPTPSADAYLELGYHNSVNALRNSKIGDLYTFSESLLSTELGAAQLRELVAEMKTYYGIA